MLVTDTTLCSSQAAFRPVADGILSLPQAPFYHLDLLQTPFYARHQHHFMLVAGTI
jgi:hypothetical protein